MTKINTSWHTAHRMPTNATLAQKITWYEGHAQHCQCRDSRIHLRKLRAKQRSK